MTKSRKVMNRVGKEMRTKPPRQLALTRRKFGARRAAKQRAAIFLSKSRRAGARIPRGRA